MKILIPGIAGGFARQVARRLFEKGHEVVGIDARPWPGAPRNIEVHQVDIRKRGAEAVFRRFRPDTVVHMATVTSLVVRGSDERSRINLGGTRAVFQHCKAYGVKHCVFVGRHTYYGAAPDLPLYHQEDEPPNALGRFPELADLVAADLFASNAIWRMPEMTTSILRCCYTLGPSGHGTLAGFLKGRAVPMVMGFDPLFQFMHEEDATDAVVLAAEKKPAGIFNVAGPQPVPLSLVVREAGRPALPIPEFLLTSVLGRRGLPQLPTGALEHLKHPIVTDDTTFRAATGYDHTYDELESVRSFADAFPRRR